MSADEIVALLADPVRSGAPEPTLLPWLARRMAGPDLHSAAMAAASVSSLAPRDDGWPVIADAVAQVLAERAAESHVLGAILDSLPPVAAQLSREVGGQIDWTQVRPDGRGYAALAGLVPLREVAELADRPLWAEVLAAAIAAPLPPLADLRSLAWLVSEGAGGKAAETDEEAVYLLPFRSLRAGDRRQAVEAVTAAAEDERYWYAAALLARAAPYLDRPAREQVGSVTARFPVLWAAHLGRMVEDPVDPRGSAYDELAASHPTIALLDELAEGADPVDLAEVCLAVTRRITERLPSVPRWEPDDEEWEPPSQTPQAYRLREYRQRLLGLREPEVRYLNVYVAESGQEQPVPDAPLIPGTDYEVRCNIGPADDRTLLDQGSARFPEQLLPDAPLTLHAVLFVDGKATADAPIELGAAGASAWVSLPLPCPEIPSVIIADLAIYYDVAVVMLCSLTIPVGSSQRNGPHAELRYRLSRSLSDLPKLAGRTLSVIDPGAVPAVYVNGLTFAATEFHYSRDEVKKAAFTVRNVLYSAHFIPSRKSERSKYTLAGNRRHEKPLSGLIEDLRQLAWCGSAIYANLFRDADLGTILRSEAEARDRPPILQVVSSEPQSIPWACVYDFPVSGDVSEYEPCPSIAEFGPGGNGDEPPVTCPYEDRHRNGPLWKLNQLCPWGFWGLSAIIEQPPSTKRDLESRITCAASRPVILMAYDTELDGRLREQHLSALRSEHGEALLDPQIVKRLEVQNSLAKDMDVIYFYCHVIEDQTSPAGIPIPAIELGREKITANDVSSWGRTRIPTRHPLVVINGCRSAETPPGFLFNLISPFIDGVQACGVIGTEIAIEQGLGGWAMELFLSALRDNPVGEALRRVRWEMFRSGNVMGLGYTPYCLAGLTLLPLPELPVPELSLPELPLPEEA